MVEKILYIVEFDRELFPETLERFRQLLKPPDHRPYKVGIV